MRVMHHPWIKLFRSMRFMQLLFFIWATMLVQAVFHDSLLIGLVVNLLYLNVLLVTLSANGAHRSVQYFLVGLWICSLGARVFSPDGFEEIFFLFSKSMGSLLLAVCIGNMMRYMLFGQRVTADMLFACIVIYILLATLFAQLYSIIDVLLPGSFSHPVELPMENHHLRDITYSYFSFVTIATLGYGDIAPRHPVAQMLSSIEAVVGQFYVAIVVARLMSLYAVEKRKLAE
jgi:voltage-gated potassium channel